MNSKHHKTLAAIFTKPTQGSIRFSNIEALIVGLGGAVREGDGSRVAFQLGNSVTHVHRPHPGKDAKKYQVEGICTWRQDQGVKP